MVDSDGNGVAVIETTSVEIRRFGDVDLAFGSTRERASGSGAKSMQSRHGSTATVSVMATATTPWGTATVVEEVSLPQRKGDRRFASLVQLLETAKGETLVRFAYATDGTARRGPVTFRGRDLERLRRRARAETAS